MAKLKDVITNKFLDKRDAWLENGPMEVVARGDHEEYAAITKKSKIKCIGYAGATAVGGYLIGETDGVAHVATIAGTAMFGVGVWNNASKILLYGRGVDPIQTQQARDHIDETRY